MHAAVRVVQAVARVVNNVAVSVRVMTPVGMNRPLQSSGQQNTAFLQFMDMLNSAIFWMFRGLLGGITLWEQRTRDLLLQAQAANEIASRRTQWSRANTDAAQAIRESVIRDLFVVVRRLMGITHPGVRLVFRGNEELDGRGGGFCTVSGEISINRERIDIEVLQTVVHELRHAYQWEAVHYNRHVVTNATRNAWRENMPPNYTHPIVESGFLSNAGAYLSQPLEFDAIMFSRAWTLAHLLRLQRGNICLCLASNWFLSYKRWFWT